MKLLLILLLPITILAQQTVGMCYGDIMEDSVNIGCYEDEDFLYKSTSVGVWAYYFNKHNICNESVFYPNSWENKHLAIELFDENYTVIDQNNWTVISRGILIDVKLEDDTFYFTSKSIK